MHNKTDMADFKEKYPYAEGSYNQIHYNLSLLDVEMLDPIYELKVNTSH